MNPSDEKVLAQRFLKLKRDGFPHPLRVSFGLKQIHLYRYTCFIVIGYIGYLNWSEPVWRYGIVAFYSFYLGCILTELHLFIESRDSWPFIVKITNWQQVEAIAQEGAPETHASKLEDSKTGGD